jgi:hypothetical protein
MLKIPAPTNVVEAQDMLPYPPLIVEKLSLDVLLAPPPTNEQPPDAVLLDPLPLIEQVPVPATITPAGIVPLTNNPLSLANTAEPEVRVETQVDPDTTKLF